MDTCPDKSTFSMPRDTHVHDSLTDTIYRILPARTLDLSAADIRTGPIPAKRSYDAKSPPSSRAKVVPDGRTDRIFSLGYWTPPKSIKRSRLDAQRKVKMDLHQSTCLILNGSNDVESDLWILPDFDEWEVEAETSPNLPPRRDGEWETLVERAVNSNRERLRRKLEGDGWDFVGGKYGEDQKAGQLDDTSTTEESVDEEFDVVVLEVSCVA
jgi:hypothetical protein